MDWIKVSQGIVATIRSYMNDADGWKQVKKSKDATVWSKQSPEWNGALYRSECVVDAEPRVVFRYIEPRPDGPRSHWDRAIKALELIDTIDDNTTVVRTITHSAFGGLISSRDFTDVAVTTETDDFISTSAAAVEHPKCTPTSEHVRGRNYPCSIICYKIPNEPRRTRVVSYVQSELGGMLPKTLIDQALPSNMIDFYSALKQQLRDDGHVTSLTNGHSAALQNGDC